MLDFKPNRRQFLEGASCLPFVAAFARCTFAQSVSTKLPASSALHPSKPVLYVAKRIAEYGGLPRGTIEAYSIDRQTGQLAFIDRHSLSLSATEPQSLAVSPDGQHLVVAAFGGGVYNVFSLAPDGQIGPITGILKEVGCGRHPIHQASAHPHSVLFDSKGHHIISSDFGCDRLSVFAIEDGELIRKSRLEVAAGSGPGALALDSSGTRLSVCNELLRSTSLFTYNSGVIRLTQCEFT